LNPPLLFVWAEAHALAGHSLVVSLTGGCLACGMNATGTFFKRALDWETGGNVKRIPACGGFFQPYGAINISAIRRMGAEHAVDVLLEGASRSSIRSWISSEKELAKREARLRTEFRNFFGENIYGNQVLTADWPTEDKCHLCAGKRQC